MVENLKSSAFAGSLRMNFNQPKMLQTLRIFLLFIGTSLLLDAADDAIRTQFQCLGWAPIPHPVYVLKGQKKEWIKVPHRGLSATYDYYGPSPMVIYREGTNAEGLKFDQPVASVPIDSKRSVLLISPNADRLQVKRLDNGQMFMPAHVSIYNLSNDSLAFALGEDRFTLQPNQSHFADMTKDLELNSPSIPQLKASIAAPDQEGKWNLIYRKRWPLSTSSSILVFAINDNEHVKVQLVRNPDVK
ncbi:Unannotated [Lentimonas sp. CC4]|nr:Unannotated [Lentimonas sp. CC4]CAA7076081.1 Unannotated [Lentimonas sp. CC4]CAA7170926.1 Unannotated [Lentimonas sp. CC21]CAA7181131.1 Unannotated [Lentimonas sp. CC8]